MHIYICCTYIYIIYTYSSGLRLLRRLDPHPSTGITAPYVCHLARGRGCPEAYGCGFAAQCCDDRCCSVCCNQQQQHHRRHRRCPLLVTRHYHHPYWSLPLTQIDTATDTYIANYEV